MEGDPRNPKVSLLKKYNIPVEHLSYEYVEKCNNKKELERIIRILRSGEEGSYPDLLRVAEDTLRGICPESRVLRVETPILTKESLTSEEWNAVENELLSWEKEMKVMDESLDFEKSRYEVVGNKNMPDVRKVHEGTTKTKSQKTKAITNNKNMRIKSGDYSAWDKFDVDKELLKIDVEEERKREENEKKKREAAKQIKEKKVQIGEVDKESYTSMEQQVLANQAKDRGNECYKSGDLESALKYYDISIRLYATANAFNNRAMTYLKLKKYENAVEDCNKVLQLEKSNIKALHRRATAYQNLSETQDKNVYNELALQDLLKIVNLEPNNKVAQLDLQKLKKKLNIEDTGRKFRMAISESGEDEGKVKQAGVNVSDNIPIDKLPLTYYGPSTSTFKCEPYSMVHRALSGSCIPGQVMCKCNSNRTRQNPLCRTCGEAMSTPKPSTKPAKPKSEIKLKAKEDNEAKNQVLREQANKNIEIIESKVSETPGVNVEDTIQTPKTEPPRDDNKISNDVQLQSNVVDTSQGVEFKIENVTDANNKIDESVNQVDLKQSNIACKEVSVSNTTKEEAYEVIPNTREENSGGGKPTPPKNESKESPEIECDNKNPEISSSHDVNRLSKKSKSKKKKSKEQKESKTIRKHLEPVKIVHAAKYLHPTSVEPKIKSENSLEPKMAERDVRLCTNGQFKAFVPNKKCFSTDYKTGTFTPSPASFPPSDDLRISNEGNKENISQNKNVSNVEGEEKEGRIEDMKKDLVNSAFEFMRIWEELKGRDESFAKRAEIIRMIKPCDLGKVIGIKLDSDMLSCLLECLDRHIVENDPKTVVELLKQLPQLPRFGLISMFLAENDKKKMKKLIETAEGKGFKLEEDVKKALSMTS